MHKSTVLALLALGAAGAALAQEQGRVLSSTPIIQQVPLTRQICNAETVYSGSSNSGAGAILGAIAHNANKHEDRYDDDRYQGARHSSYVPSWMVGRFEGYNAVYDRDVTLTIDADGRATARTRDQTVDGWINEGRLNVGNTVFDVDQTRDGLVTTQVGDRHNEVRYRRVR